MIELDMNWLALAVVLLWLLVVGWLTWGVIRDEHRD